MSCSAVFQCEECGSFRTKTSGGWKRSGTQFLPSSGQFRVNLSRAANTYRGRTPFLTILSVCFDGPPLLIKSELVVAPPRLCPLREGFNPGKKFPLFVNLSARFATVNRFLFKYGKTYETGHCRGDQQ